MAAYAVDVVRHLRDELELLFGSIDLTTGERARGVLSEKGLHSTLHSQGFDDEELPGGAARWYQLFVPKGTRKAARAHLNAAWGERAVTKLG